MDWKRAKTILILMFFILNIFLASVLYKNLRVEEISQQTIDNTGIILEKNNVHIERPIPKYIGNDFMLQSEEMLLDKNNILNKLLGDNYIQTGSDLYKQGKKSILFTSTEGFEFTDKEGSNGIYSDSKSDLNLKLKDFFKKLELPFDEFKQDSYKADNVTRITYKGEFQSYTVFDNYIDVEVSKTGISIKYHYKKPVKITSRDITVVPVYEILITKITSYPGITISDVDMGFKGYSEVDKETKNLYEGLSWRIKTTSGKEFYYKASNGEQME